MNQDDIHKLLQYSATYFNECELTPVKTDMILQFLITVFPLYSQPTIDVFGCSSLNFLFQDGYFSYLQPWHKCNMTAVNLQLNFAQFAGNDHVNNLCQYIKAFVNNEEVINGLTQIFSFNTQDVAGLAELTDNVFSAIHKLLKSSTW